MSIIYPRRARACGRCGQIGSRGARAGASTSAMKQSGDCCAEGAGGEGGSPFRAVLFYRDFTVSPRAGLRRAFLPALFLYCSSMFGFQSAAMFSRFDSFTLIPPV